MDECGAWDEELVEYVRCVCVWLGRRGWRVNERIGVGFTNPVGTGECWMCVCVLVAVCRSEVVGDWTRV